MKRKTQETLRDFFSENFARQFNSYDEMITSYRLSGGHIPSRHKFNKAKFANKKSACSYQTE